MHVEANFSHDKLANVPAGDWRTSPKDAPAAGMTAMGIHLTDLFVELLGPASEAFAATTSRVAYPDNGDVVSALLRFAERRDRLSQRHPGHAALSLPHRVRVEGVGGGAQRDASRYAGAVDAHPAARATGAGDAADTSGWTRCGPMSRRSRGRSKAARPTRSPTPRRSATSPCWRRSAARPRGAPVRIPLVPPVIPSGERAG